MSEIVGLDDGKLLRSDFVYDATQGKKQSEINQNISSKKPTINYSGLKTTTVAAINTDTWENQTFTIPRGVNIVTVMFSCNGYQPYDLYTHLGVCRASDHVINIAEFADIFFDTPQNNVTAQQGYHSAKATAPMYLEEDTEYTIFYFSNTLITFTWELCYINFGY